MSDDMVRCSACGTPHGSIEDATVCCEKVKPPTEKQRIALEKAVKKLHRKTNAAERICEKAVGQAMREYIADCTEAMREGADE